MNYLVATTKSWNIRAFREHTPALTGNWQLITAPELLTTEYLVQLQPEYIFFPHWSWKVPEKITKHYNCVCFHMTDLPFGRGGSPLQNLINQGIRQTQLSALQMTPELDAGPVYIKCPLDLAGTAQHIFERAAPLVYQLIQQIITGQFTAQAQQGDVVYFQRRTPAQSLLPANLPADKLYDFIRMLDAESYPPAFLEFGDWRLEFNDAQQTSDGTVQAKVCFRPRKGTAK